MWQFWIDVGGTFTDCLAQSPEGKIHQTKVLSSGVFKGQLRLADLADVAGSADSAGLDEPPGRWNSVQLSLLNAAGDSIFSCLLYSSPSPRDRTRTRMPSSA